MELRTSVVFFGARRRVKLAFVVYCIVIDEENNIVPCIVHFVSHLTIRC